MEFMKVRKYDILGAFLKIRGCTLHDGKQTPSIMISELDNKNAQQKKTSGG
jgi:hypothetical protein